MIQHPRDRHDQSKGHGVLDAPPSRGMRIEFDAVRTVLSTIAPHQLFAVPPILSCVFVSKSDASCRSCNWVAGSPEMRLTLRPRCTAGRLAIWLVQRCTCL